jgi:hypothetical protein
MGDDDRIGLVTGKGTIGKHLIRLGRQHGILFGGDVRLVVIDRLAPAMPVLGARWDRRMK